MPRLRQVIGNLMTNALTHTPSDASITVRLRESGADERRRPRRWTPEGGVAPDRGGPRPDGHPR
jgi:signal transduction histidine kinase